MNRDRLATVLHLRELVERRRLAERAAADRAAAEAAARHTSAQLALEDHTVPSGRVGAPHALVAHRLGGLALDEQVTLSSMTRQQTALAAELAANRLVAAAVERRSAERLVERRQQAAAREAAKVQGRRDDELGLQIWRRSS